MVSPRKGSPRWAKSLRRAFWAGLSVGWILPSVGCQVEYAGMTLPSGKYLWDDVQYFPPGPDFPWANTQAATQRARMTAQGITPAEVPAVQPAAPVAPPAPPQPAGVAPGVVPPAAPGVAPVPPPAGAVPVPPAPGAVPPPAG
jgi:hypothetical protein